MEIAACPAHDPKCYIDLANDALEGVARTLESSARSYSSNSGPVVVAPGTGELRWTGYAPEVVIAPALQ